MELEKLIKTIFDTDNYQSINFQVTHKLKKEINAFELLSHILEKVTIDELLELYYEKGGSQKKIERFLTKK